MNRIARAAAGACAATLAVTAWAGTGFKTTWKNPEAKPASFQGKKVVALYISNDEGLRRGVEGSLAAELNRRGIQGVAAYTIIPAGEMKEEAKARARIEAAGAAGVVALRLVGRDQELGGSPAQYYAAPPYSSMWGGYWGMGFGGLYDAGYVRTEQVFFVETLIYALEQNKLVWAGQSKTTNPKSVDQLVRDLVGKVAGEVKKAGLVQKGD
jgi:hypothetical protein